MFFATDCYLHKKKTRSFLTSIEKVLLGYTRMVKLKSRILESRVARILGDYTTGRLRLRVILTAEIQVAEYSYEQKCVSVLHYVK